MATDEDAPTQFTQVADGEVGSTQMVTIPVAEDFVALRADLVSSWVMPGGDLGISLLAFQAHVQQISALVIEQGGQKGFHPTNMFGSPVLVEVGTVRVPAAGAMELVVGLLRNMLNYKLATLEQIEVALATIPIRIQK
ncbi:MAG TPA: hypothetical protein VME40_01440 [Caulobacteraceae bacterium]|nr:hypothetical protein [Caulobacteraceae bacterium]